MHARPKVYVPRLTTSAMRQIKHQRPSAIPGCQLGANWRLDWLHSSPASAQTAYRPVNEIIKAENNWQVDFCNHQSITFPNGKTPLPWIQFPRKHFPRYFKCQKPWRPPVGLRDRALSHGQYIVPQRQTGRLWCCYPVAALVVDQTGIFDVPPLAPANLSWNW